MTMTRDTAERHCAQYQHLCHRQEYDAIIEAVTVAPADELNRWFFLQFYAAYRHPEQALAFYNQQAFDVVVISRKPHGTDTEGYSCMPLADYLRGNALSVNENRLSAT